MTSIEERVNFNESPILIFPTDFPCFQQRDTERGEQRVAAVGALSTHRSAQEQEMRPGVSVSPDQTITPVALGTGQHPADRDNRQFAERGITVVSKLQQVPSHVHEIDRGQSRIESDREHEPTEDSLCRGER